MGEATVSVDRSCAPRPRSPPTQSGRRLGRCDGAPVPGILRRGKHCGRASSAPPEFVVGAVVALEVASPSTLMLAGWVSAAGPGPVLSAQRRRLGRRPSLARLAQSDRSRQFRRGAGRGRDIGRSAPLDLLGLALHHGSGHSAGDLLAWFSRLLLGQELVPEIRDRVVGSVKGQPLPDCSPPDGRPGAHLTRGPGRLMGLRSSRRILMFSRREFPQDRLWDVAHRTLADDSAAFSPRRPWQPGRIRMAGCWSWFSSTAATTGSTRSYLIATKGMPSIAECSVCPPTS